MLVLSAQFLDLLWPVFLLLDVEHVRIDPGNTAVTPLDFYDYPLSHSLLTAVGWAAVVGGSYYLFRRSARNAVVLYAVVLSHWILDAVTHRPDLPLIPAIGPMVGLGLWHSVVWTILVELAPFVFGIMIFVRHRNVQGKGTGFGFWAYACFLTAVWIANIIGPPPSTENAIGAVGLSIWILVGWAYWIDCTTPKEES